MAKTKLGELEHLWRKINGALKSAIDAHGPITDLLITSTTKRIVGAISTFEEGTDVMRELSEIDSLRRELAERDAKINELAIARDKEFWRSYADHTTKELLRSNGALTAKLIEFGRDVAARDARIRTLNSLIMDYISPDKLSAIIDPLEASLADAQSENVVLREQISEAWSAHGEIQRQVADRDERIRELDDKLKALGDLETSHISFGGVVLGNFEDVLRKAKAFVTGELEQQLQAAQERLAEAEQLLRDVLETTPVDEHGHQLGVRDIKEHFAKHAPAIDPTAEIDPPELESDEP